MDILTTPRSAFLLEAGIEVLHQQSIEWLNEVAFWRDEVSFLYVLMLSKTVRNIPITSKNSIGNIEDELLKLTNGDLDVLQHEVEAHERFLSKTLDSKVENLAEYREKHKQLAVKFDRFEKRFKALKKDIFDFVKEHKKALIVN